jgi:hypothetical protein
MERIPEESPSKYNIRKFFNNILGSIYDLYLNLKHRERRNINEAEDIARTVNYFLTNIEGVIEAAKKIFEEREDISEEQKDNFNKALNEFFYSKRQKFIEALSNIISSCYYTALKYGSKIMEKMKSPGGFYRNTREVSNLALDYVKEVEKIVNEKEYESLKFFLFVLFDLREIVRKYLNIEINVGDDFELLIRRVFITPIIFILDQEKEILTPSEEELFSYLKEEEQIEEIEDQIEEREISEEERRRREEERKQREINLERLRINALFEREYCESMRSLIIDDVLSKLDTILSKIYSKINDEYYRPSAYYRPSTFI